MSEINQEPVPYFRQLCETQYTSSPRPSSASSQSSHQSRSGEEFSGELDQLPGSKQVKNDKQHHRLNEKRVMQNFLMGQILKVACKTDIEFKENILCYKRMALLSVFMWLLEQCSMKYPLLHTPPPSRQKMNPPPTPRKCWC